MLPPKYPHVERFIQSQAGHRPDLLLYVQAVAELANEELRQLAPDDKGFASDRVAIVDILVYGYAGKDVGFATYSRREGLDVAEGRAKLWQAVEDLPDTPYPIGAESRLKDHETRSIAGVGLLRTEDGAEYDLVFHHPNITMEEAFGMLKHVAKKMAEKAPPKS